MADDAEFRRVCSVLESISQKYPPESAEVLALQEAATAFIIVQQNEMLKAAYLRLRQAAGGVLTESMKDDLRRHGIAPDRFEK